MPTEPGFSVDPTRAPLGEAGVGNEPIAGTAGWYPDPDASDRERWWGGTAWTDETRYSGAWVEPPAVRAGSLYSMLAIVCGLLAIAILPIVMASVGLVVGLQAWRREERLAAASIVVVVTGGVIGVVPGFMAA